MIAGFAGLQKSENELVPRLIEDAGVDWIVECAPTASPSPVITAPRHRMLLNAAEFVWPCRVPADLMPFADEALPAVLLRHLFWLQAGTALLEQSVRCLKPGGLLVSISANPWHRASWRELGRDAFRLPAWPRFLLQHARHGLLIQYPVRQQWQGFIPGVAPLLVVVARKPPRAALVHRLRVARPRGDVRPAMPTTCRAA
jgi:SAM-dependent methyltransferase